MDHINEKCTPPNDIQIIGIGLDQKALKIKNAKTCVPKKHFILLTLSKKKSCT